MRSVPLAVVVAAMATSAASAQVGTGFTISDGDVFFTQVDSPTSGTATGVSGANLRFNGSTGTDHLFENWWWYRVEGVDTREFAFNNASGTTAAGNVATTTWNGLGNGSFNASLTYVAVDTGDNTGYVLETMVVTNVASTPITLNLFNYADFDVNATTLNSASGGIPTMTITAGTWTIEYSGYGADNYQVTTFASLRSQLTNSTAENLNNTGLPLSGDFTGGFQWVLSLAPGESATVTERLTSIPAPGAAALLGIGGLLAIRRRR